MHSPRQDRSKLRGYAFAIVICLCALATALLNGLYRGHWFTFGIAADAIVCASVTVLFITEKRKRKGDPLSGS